MSSTQHSVMVVEDEPELCDLYEYYLSEDYNVISVNRGKKALQHLDYRIACILLDRRMPDISGDNVLQQVREQEYNCRVAMVTAVEPDFDIIEMGFDDYVVKPISKQALVALVRSLIALNSSDDVIQEYYQLSVKRAVLENLKSERILGNSRNYNQLVEEIHRLEEESELPLASIIESEGLSWRHASYDELSRDY